MHRTLVVLLIVLAFLIPVSGLCLDRDAEVEYAGLFAGSNAVTLTANATQNSTIMRGTDLRGSFSLACDLSDLGNATVDIEMYVSNAEDRPASAAAMWQTANYLLANDANATAGQNSDGKLWINVELNSTGVFRWWAIGVEETAGVNATDAITIDPAFL